MTIDFETIKAGVDCRELIERDLGAPTSRSGGWVSWPCPFHAERTMGGAFKVKANGYHCFSCGAHGDALDWLIRHHGVTYQEAVERLNGGPLRADPREIAERASRAAERQAQREEAERRRQADIDQRLARFTTQEIWDAYHRRLQAEQREWWAEQGIPEGWQDYLKLGYTPEKIFNHDGQQMSSPAYTIPYFRADWRFVTMQYRLVKPPNPSDKYRFEYGLGAPFYMATPTEPIGAVAVICEGAKKAIVTAVSGNTGASVLAIPSKAGWRSSGILDVVRDCEQVYVILDPDAEKDARDLAQAIGRAGRVVTLPGKIDDMFTRWGMSAEDLKRAMRQAVRA